MKSQTQKEKENTYYNEYIRMKLILIHVNLINQRNHMDRDPHVISFILNSSVHYHTQVKQMKKLLGIK